MEWIDLIIRAVFVISIAYGMLTISHRTHLILKLLRAHNDMMIEDLKKRYGKDIGND